MWVEVVKSIALKPTLSMTGAMVSVLAVSMPSAAQTHWLPSRSDVSTSWISAKARLHGHWRLREQARQETGVDSTGLKLPVREHCRVEREVGGHPADAG